MQSSDIPDKFPIPFANNAGASYIRAIPQAHQVPTTTDAPASLYDGFPPETFQPLASGGIPVSGADTNGILKQLSAWARWLSAGVPARFDSDFSTAIGGYPKYTILASSTPGKLWQSTAENNTTDPDGGSPSGWFQVSPARQFRDGVVNATLTAGSTYSVSFTPNFTTTCTSVALTGCNSSASALRDNWPQIVSFDKAGCTYVIQGSNTGGDNTLSGISWQAWGD